MVLFWLGLLSRQALNGALKPVSVVEQCQDLL